MAMLISRRCVLRVLRRTTWASKQNIIISRGIRLSNAASSVISSGFPDIHVPKGWTVVDSVFEDIDKYGDTEALIDGASGRSYKFSQVKPLTKRVASALSRQGYKKDELVGQIGLVEPKMIITAPHLVETALNVKRRLSNVQDVVVLGENEDCSSFLSLLEDDGSAFPNVDIAPSDLFALLFSSGTTGLPKAVMMTHRLTAWNLAQQGIESLIDAKHGEATSAILPFFHTYGQCMMMHCLRHGVTQVSLPRYDHEQFLKMIQDYKLNQLFLAPPIVVFLAKDPLVEKYDLSSIKRIYCGGAPIGGDIVDATKKRLSVQSITQGYGLTETGPVTHAVPLAVDSALPSSIGKLVPNTEAKIVDTETGKELGPREVGELCIRGPQVMPGYYKNPEATAQCMDNDGFFHTGDVGYYDEDEIFHIVDRLKELIKYKAFQVAPAELEALLITHPSISDAGVIGVHDDEAGEVPRAYVVRTNKSLTEEEVKDFVAGKLAPIKKLRGGVEFVETIPKSAAGKILRKELRAWAQPQQIERERG